MIFSSGFVGFGWGGRGSLRPSILFYFSFLGGGGGTLFWVVLKGNQEVTTLFGGALIFRVTSGLKVVSRSIS